MKKVVVIAILAISLTACQANPNGTAQPPVFVYGVVQSDSDKVQDLINCLDAKLSQARCEYEVSNEI